MRANWALYVENYLDGLHIPFVHNELAGALDYGSYITELFRYGNLQLGVAQSGLFIEDHVMKFANRSGLWPAG